MYKVREGPTVFYCSKEKHCNPDYIPGKKLVLLFSTVLQRNTDHIPGKRLVLLFFTVQQRNTVIVTISKVRVVLLFSTVQQRNTVIMTIPQVRVGPTIFCSSAEIL